MTPALKQLTLGGLLVSLLTGTMPMNPADPSRREPQEAGAPSDAGAPTGDTPRNGSPTDAGAEAAVRKLYELVSFEAGTTPDWDQVRELIIESAVVVLRTGRETTTVFDREGFIAAFVAFIEQASVQETGFTERIVSLQTTVFRDIAHVLVVFESHIPGSGRPPGRGVDSIQLLRTADGWRIVSITNDRPTAEHPIPEHFGAEPSSR
jgi:hypothetical protein